MEFPVTQNLGIDGAGRVGTLAGLVVYTVGYKERAIALRSGIKGWLRCLSTRHQGRTLQIQISEKM
ncbi:MAG: hypothetical protein V7L31_24370 [Nostoc sp.]|uniref:hypothetical protein n=1 Tax=Nostoc sp. TaxID=1180 RepID=UPI002FF4295F